MDTILGLFGDYGPKVLAWVFAILGTLLVKYVLGSIKNQKVQGILSRAYDAVTTAVLEVSQTYADALKAGHADGKLTPEERTAAKRMAIDTAKSYIGAKGLKVLASVAGIDVDDWLGGKVEAEVKALKLAEAKPGPQ